MTSWGSLAAAAAVWSWSQVALAQEPAQPPDEIPYAEGAPAPQGYELRTYPRTGPLIAGSILIAVPWSIGLHTGGALLVPVAGPWIQLITLSKRGCDHVEQGMCDFLVVDGILQGVGALLVAGAWAAPRRTWVHQDISVSLVPAPLGLRAFGIGAVGTF